MPSEPVQEIPLASRLDTNLTMLLSRRRLNIDGLRFAVRLAMNFLLRCWPFLGGQRRKFKHPSRARRFIGGAHTSYICEALKSETLREWSRGRDSRPGCDRAETDCSQKLTPRRTELLSSRNPSLPCFHCFSSSHVGISNTLVLFWSSTSQRAYVNPSG